MEHEELQKLEEVRAFIDAETERLRNQEKQEMHEARERGRDFSMTNPYGAIYGQAYELQEAIGQNMENSNRCRADVFFLENMRLAPYFGRVDFKEDGYGEDKYYVGLRSLADRDTYEILVYDWRTPVCSLFYAGEIGKASYDAPMGKIEGDITRIRQYRFQKGELTACWDADLRIDDSVLRDVLSGASSDRLKVIVCSIQREQNRAIRYNTKSSLAVFGPAGCGKTSIGMHRLAWLLYEMRSSMVSKDILLFTNNAAFLSYVSGVLPDLGEEEVRSCLFTSLFDSYLPSYRIRDYYEQTEALLAHDEARAEIIRAVYEPAFIDYVDHCLDAISCRFRDIRVYGETVLSADELVNKYNAYAKSLSVRARLQLVGDWVRDEIEDYFLAHRVDIITRILATCDIYDSTQKLFEGLREGVTNNALQMVGAAVENDTVPLYYRFFKEWRKNDRFACALGQRMGAGTLFFEDALVSLYIAAKLGACVPDPMPQHILLDEAQDYCLLQHKIFRLLYPKTVFTLLADVQQALVPQLNTCSEADIAEVYGAQIIKLGKSYRSTKPISTFAKQFLADGADYDTFDRPGHEPFVYYTESRIAQCAKIASGIPEDFNAVCFVLPTAADAVAFHKKLVKRLPDCALAADAHTKLGNRFTVMPVTLTKGLEFDAVVIPYAEKLAENHRVAYMMTTRALHELHLLYKQKPAETAQMHGDCR